MKKIIALLAVFFISTVIQASTDIQNRFGRPDPDHLDWSVDPKVVTEFEPSGVGCQVYRIGDYTLLHNHALYWSDEEHADTSKDMRASVIVFKGEQRVFVARGNKFLKFKADPKTNAFTFQYWTGVQGDAQITALTLDLKEHGVCCSTKQFSTKDDAIN